MAPANRSVFLIQFLSPTLLLLDRYDTEIIINLRHVTANASFASYHFRNALLEDFPSPGPFDMVSEPFCYFFAFQDHSGLPLVVPKSYGSVENKWEGYHT
jgi:hypothetical protein